ncbi:MAG TPA: hypothetical protein VMU75_02280 [Acidimicrobiales bacterium]|nr:hypothetical protein [Acidimicrobiales bacterium]
MTSTIIPACTALLPAGTRLDCAFTAQTGIKPTWRFLSYWLMFLGQHRIVAVSGDTVHVFRTGRTIFSATKPKSLAYTVARSEVMLPRLQGSWTRVPLGPERMWVSRRAYSIVGPALGGATAAVDA